MGWTDEVVIQFSLERLHRLKINRVRVTVAGRTGTYFGEPVMRGPSWTPLITPWPAGRGVRYLHYPGRAGQLFGMGFGLATFNSVANLGLAEDLYRPGFDFTRFRPGPLAEVRACVAFRPGTGRRLLARAGHGRQPDSPCTRQRG